MPCTAPCTPSPRYHWLCTLGGRSVRPILDRLDYALTQLVDGYEVRGRGVCVEEGGGSWVEWQGVKEAAVCPNCCLPLTCAVAGSCVAC